MELNKEYYWISFNTNENNIKETLPNLNYNTECLEESNGIDPNELLDELISTQDFEDESNKTLVVNLFGGPGSGKSTTAAGVFYELKSLGVNCELAAEYAKDLTWEERHITFRDQVYIFGKQFHRIHRLLDKVDVIITDSPILLTSVYDSEKRPTLRKLVLEEHTKMWTFNVFINRVKKFNPKGRLHDETESRRLDARIINMLTNDNIPFVSVDGNPKGKDEIVSKIILTLNNK